MKQTKLHVLNKSVEQYREIRISDLRQNVNISYMKVSQTRFQEVALDGHNPFDLICIIVKVFVSQVKNAIVCFLMFFMRGHTCSSVDFWSCFFRPQKVEQRCQ